MLRPEPMPAAAMTSPAAETDTSCLGFFSRRVGLISLCCILVAMSAFGFLTSISYMVVASGGVLAIFIIYFLVNIADGGLSALLLLGIRDNVVRTRLNAWLIWNFIYSVVLLLLVIIELCVLPLPAGLIVLYSLQAVQSIVFRVYCVWAGWKYREELMSAPPPPTQHRPDMGAF